MLKVSALPRVTMMRNTAVAVATRAQSTIAQDSHASTHFRVTLRRSAIGLPKHTERVLEGLGLHKRLQSVYQPQNPAVAGAVLAVKELVHVENVRPLHSDTPDPTASNQTMWVNEAGEVVDAGRIAWKAPKGFKIIGNLLQEERDMQLKRNLLKQDAV